MNTRFSYNVQVQLQRLPEKFSYIEACGKRIIDLLTTDYMTWNIKKRRSDLLSLLFQEEVNQPLYLIGIKKRDK